MRSSHPTAHDVTVVIPTVGRDILRESLAALERGSLWPGKVIIVDQGRVPALEALADQVRTRSFDTVWIPSDVRGRAAGVNLGVAGATTRFVAITDDDCLADTEWIASLAGRLRQTPEAIVTGRVEAGSDDVISIVTAREERIQRRPAIRFDRLSGGNMAIARTVFDQIGGLDEDSCLRTAEDGEFAYRALRAGVPILYAPEVAVTHVGWRDVVERGDQYQSYARSQAAFYGKYLRRGDLFIATRAAVHLGRSLRRWLVGRLHGQHELAMNGRAYVLGLVPGIRLGWRSGAGR